MLSMFSYFGSSHSFGTVLGASRALSFDEKALFSDTSYHLCYIFYSILSLHQNELKRCHADATSA